MADVEDLFLNLVIAFVLFCIVAGIYTRLAKRSALLQSAVGLPA